MKRLHLVLYGLFGILWLGLGVVAIAAMAPGEPSGEEAHLLRELGAAIVFVGLMHLWCMRNYERRLPVHLGLLVFAALFAGIHWREWMLDARTWTSPVVNSVPLVVLAVMLRGRRERPPGAEAARR